MRGNITLREEESLLLFGNEKLELSFDKVTGMRVLTRRRTTEADSFTLDGTEFVLNSPRGISSESVGAQVLAVNGKGEPVFSEHKLGNGKVYCLYYPIEYIAATQPMVTDGENAIPFEKIYRRMDIRNAERCADTDVPTMGLTEHIVSETERIIAVVNYEPAERTADISLKEGWSIAGISSVEDRAVLCGNNISVPGNNGALVRIKR